MSSFASLKGPSVPFRQNLTYAGAEGAWYHGGDGSLQRDTPYGGRCWTTACVSHTAP